MKYLIRICQPGLSQCAACQYGEDGECLCEPGAIWFVVVEADSLIDLKERPWAYANIDYDEHQKVYAIEQYTGPLPANGRVHHEIVFCEAGDGKWPEEAIDET